MASLTGRHGYLLTLEMVAHELHGLAGEQAKVSELVELYDIRTDDITRMWWCDGHAVQLPSFTTAYLARSLEEFSSVVCEPTIDAWWNRSGRDRGPFGPLRHAIRWFRIERND